MAQPVRVRGLTEQEGQKLQRTVRRASTSTVRYRRAMMLLASAGGNTAPVIARLVQAAEGPVCEVIHKFNEIGLACLDPRWARGRPRHRNVARPTEIGREALRRSWATGSPTRSPTRSSRSDRHPTSTCRTAPSGTANSARACAAGSTRGDVRDPGHLRSGIFLCSGC